MMRGGGRGNKADIMEIRNIKLAQYMKRKKQEEKYEITKRRENGDDSMRKGNKSR